MRSFKSALALSYPIDAPYHCRSFETLQLVGSEVCRFEGLANEIARRTADNHITRLGDVLQSRSEIWSLSNDRLSVVSLFTDQIADNHDAGRNTDAGA